MQCVGTDASLPPDSYDSYPYTNAVQVLSARQVWAQRSGDQGSWRLFTGVELSGLGLSIDRFRKSQVAAALAVVAVVAAALAVWRW